MNTKNTSKVEAAALSDLPHLLTMNDLCQLFRCTRRTIERKIQDGVLPKPVRVLAGRALRWNRAAIANYLRGLEREVSHAAP